MTDRRPPAPALSHRLAWGLLLAVMAVAQTVAQLTPKSPLDYLSATVWWAYGERFSATWWFLGLPVLTLLTWAGVHWLFPEVTGRHLLYAVIAAVLVAAGGWLFTR